MDVSGFYDRLAGAYHLIYSDWRKGVARQGAVLDRLIRTYLSDGPHRVLDCTCGIGTQAIGLATRGHSVHGTDLSAASVERAAREAATFAVDATFDVADVRALQAVVPGEFDVVITCDNSLPHLLTDDELDAATRSMRAKLRHQGLLIASIRDYDQLVRTRPRFDDPRLIEDDAGTRVVLQQWDWSVDGSRYTVNHFIMSKSDGSWTLAHGSVEYRALLRKDLDASLARNGFGDMKWHAPSSTGYFQPVVTARAR
ncbi:MAG: class I SAM-dependent methyltransferase [Actinomycetota bacterium]